MRKALTLGLEKTNDKGPYNTLKNSIDKNPLSFHTKPKKPRNYLRNQ